MFTLTPGALDYIKQSGGNLIVELNFVSAGGWGCSKEELRGSLEAKASIGKADGRNGYLTEEHDGVTIWYDYRTAMKPGFDTITIDLKTFLIMKWFEFTGMASIKVEPELSNN